MCLGQKSPQPVATPEPRRPTFVRNPYLDDTGDDRAAEAISSGRSDLVISSGKGIGFAGRGAQGSAGAVGLPQGNSRAAGGRAPSTLAVRSTPRNAAPTNRPRVSTPSRDYTQGYY